MSIDNWADDDLPGGPEIDEDLPWWAPRLLLGVIVFFVVVVVGALWWGS